MSLQYSELRSTNGWDRFWSLGHPSKFQRVSCLGSVTARHCRSGRQPNFAALNRGRHLYSAGRPSRWALAHILVKNVVLRVSTYFIMSMLFSALVRFMYFLFPRVCFLRFSISPLITRKSSLEVASTTLRTLPPVTLNFDLWPWPSNLT